MVPQPFVIAKFQLKHPAEAGAVQDDCDAMQLALGDLNVGNDYTQGAWDNELEGATYIVPAWGGCARHEEINAQKDRVIMLL